MFNISLWNNFRIRINNSEIICELESTMESSDSAHNIQTHVDCITIKKKPFKNECGAFGPLIRKYHIQ